MVNSGIAAALLSAQHVGFEGLGFRSDSPILSGGSSSSAKASSLMEKSTVVPDVEVSLDRKCKDISDKMTRRYVKLYDRAMAQKSGAFSIEVEEGGFLRVSTIYKFSVVQQGECTAIIPDELTCDYKRGELFERVTPLGDGTNGNVWKYSALFVNKTAKTLQFKKAMVAVKTATNRETEGNLRAARVKSEVLKNYPHNYVSLVEFSTAIDGKNANVLDFHDFSPYQPAKERRMGICRDLFRGVRQLNEAGFKHFDQKPSNVRVTVSGEARVIDIDNDLYLPPIQGKTIAELNRDLPLSSVQKKFRDMELVDDEDQPVFVVATEEFHTVEQSSVEAEYKKLMEELMRAEQWAGELVSQYIKTANAIDDEIKRSTCITALSILLGVDLFEERAKSKYPLPGFMALDFSGGRFSLFSLGSEFLRASLSSALGEMNNESLVDTIVRTFHPDASTPHYVELENAFGS